MPERNLIQNPQLIMRLRRFLDVRQAHLTPTIADTVVPVVLLHDLTRTEPARIPAYAIGYEVDAAGGVPFTCLDNPADSGVTGRLRRISLVISHPTAVANSEGYRLIAGAVDLVIPAAFAGGTAGQSGRDKRATDTAVAKRSRLLERSYTLDPGGGTIPALVQYQTRLYAHALHNLGGWVSDPWVIEPEDIYLPPNTRFMVVGSDLTFADLVIDGYYEWEEQPSAPASQIAN